MAIATGTAIAIGAGISAAGAIGGAAISAHSQSNASKLAAQTESDSAANTLAFNKNVYNTTLQNEQPYLAAGQGAANQLSYLMGIPSTAPTAAATSSPQSFDQWRAGQNGGLSDLAGKGGVFGNISDGVLHKQYAQALANGQVPMTTTPSTTAAAGTPALSSPAGSFGSLTAAYPGGPFSFTGVNLQNDPAYQFDLNQGQQSIQRSAAAQGGLVSGGALKDLNDYTQGYASNQFQQSYNNALGQYQQAYNQFENQQANTFNRLSSVAGLGQNAATMTATSGNAAAGVVANTNTNTANALGSIYTNQANATGAATIGAVNGISNGFNNYANMLAQGSASSYGSAAGLFRNSAPVSNSQWAAYNGTSTPGGYIDDPTIG